MSELNKSTDEGYSGMAGMTAYNKVDGDFYLHQMPVPDAQSVKMTIQGVVDEFLYTSDQISMQSAFVENEPVKVTEEVYREEAKNVINRSVTPFALDTNAEPFNRIVIQAGAGEYDPVVSSNVSASVYDEIIAIGVEDPRPFMIKGLDIDHTAELVNEKPTNDAYIRHLSPSNEPQIASIKSPSILTSNGGPSRILVYYDAIDLTGEVVAGTTLGRSEFNAAMSPYYSSEKKAFLIVKKTIPSATTIFNIGGTPRTLSDILLKPYSSPPATSSDVQMEMIAPGGVVVLPAADFKRPIASNTLRSYGIGGTIPSPFIDITNCLITVKNQLSGYGRPRTVLNPNTPDPTSNPTHHVMTIQPSGGSDLKNYDSSKETPVDLSRSTMQVLNVIDNLVKSNENQILVSPSNKSRFAVLDDFLTTAESQTPALMSIDIALLSGRAEEFNSMVNSGSESMLEIRGRSKLMDLSDKQVERDLSLGESAPIKEIGDMGTPTVSLTLGGLGQGGIDTIPQWVEHPHLAGWKDKIVSVGNASIRNDKQTSTHYASTRALVELPLFPSMFYDIEEIHGDSEQAHPFGYEFELHLDTTMTAANRPQMAEIEGANAIDWGFRDTLSAVLFHHTYAKMTEGPSLSGTPRNRSWGIKAMNPAIQAVVTNWDLTLGTANSYIEVDDVEAFVNDSHLLIDGGTGILTNKCYVVVGEGLVSTATQIDLEYQSYYQMQVHKIDNALNRIYVDAAFVRYLNGDDLLTLNTTASTRADQHMFAGATVQLGAVLANSNASAGHTEDLLYTPDLVLRLFKDSLVVELRKALGTTTSQIYNLQTTVDGTLTQTDYIIIEEGIISMGALEFDIWHENGGSFDRPLIHPIECIPYFSGLKGISKDGTTLKYTYPTKFSLRDISLRSESFKGSVDELIREINQSSHPLAQNKDGKSAYETPLEGWGNTGGHMGYVRAFIGSEVESKTGEKGITIVIHSTIPGATGRNFAVWLSNNSSYPYRPTQCVGYGGLLATNSRNYRANSFASPLPIGTDGETFVPITTFTGAPHGPNINPLDDTNAIRTYDGVGSRFKVKTVFDAGDPTYGTLGATITGSGDPSIEGSKIISRILVEPKAIDYSVRSEINSMSSRGLRAILSVNGRLAYFETISPGPVPFSSIAIQTVIPFNSPDKFYNEFFDNAGNEIYGQEITLINPLIDSEGILFFGGGHTGLVFDISDGTNNDYSKANLNRYSSGPTGFSGFQNIGSFQGASAVLDFTNIKNEDTINDNTLRGFHHKSELINNEPQGICRAYVRMSNDSIPGEAFTATSAYTQDATEWREELYNRKVRLTSPNFANVFATGVTDAVEVTGSTATIRVPDWEFGDVVALFNNNAGTIVPEHGEVREFDPRASNSASWAVSAVVQKSGSFTHFTGPLMHGIYNDGTTQGYPWGVTVGGLPEVGGLQELTVAITSPTGLGFGLPIASYVLDPMAMMSMKVEVDSTGWTQIIAGVHPTNGAFCYMGNTIGITDPNDPGAGLVAGMFNYSDWLVSTPDQNYGVGAANPNSKTTFETESSGYAGGDADHPDVPTALQTIRDIDMAVTGCALIGVPFVNITPGAMTFGGFPATPHTGYFHQMLMAGTPTCGVSDLANADGANTAGPIHFRGYLSEVALWKRGLTFAEAGTLFASLSTW